MNLRSEHPKEYVDVLLVYKQKGKDDIEVHEGYFEGEINPGEWRYHIYYLDGFITEKDVDFVFWADMPDRFTRF